MKIEISKPKCQAYGNCADEAPDLFRLDDAGYAEVVDDGVVPAGEEGTAKRAVLSCPAQALAATE